MENKNFSVETLCPFCGKTHVVKLDETEYRNYVDMMNGTTTAFIQELFPELSADERELLNTGICETCWDSIFDW